jgi:hypothetical protein
MTGIFTTKLKQIMLPAREYESPHMLFMRELLASRPAIAADQRKGRALWWDKSPRDLALQRKMDEGRVAMRPYVYEPDE